MRQLKYLTAVVLILVAFTTASAQFGAPEEEGFQWTASWITVPGAGETDAGLYLFRKSINLDAVPDSFTVYVSADNKYKLYVNEELISVGPALGDIEHWNYETVDLRPYLQSGQNVIAARVWNEGSFRPVNQISLRTGFILQGVNEEAQVLDTDTTWKAIEDESYTPIRQSVRGYYAAGAGEHVDMHYRIRGFKSASFDDSDWADAELVFQNTGFRFGGGGERWTLIPSVIPGMELTPERLQEVRRSEGVSVPSSFPAEPAEIEVPANTTASILMDQTYLTNSYPTLVFSGGENSTIVITYAEALYDEDGVKGNRDVIEGKTISGRQDTLISDGSMNQHFTPLAYRTYRYVGIEVMTDDSPLVIEDYYATFTGYPFEYNAQLEADVTNLQEILEIGWRTARLCAVDTYMDCPYYERLQYIGDARIQLFVSYFISGDDRLAKNALNLMHNSRQTPGYTYSRYPDRQGQVIPTYSLWYISMLHDYMMYGKDPEFIDQEKLMGQRQILNYFIRYMDTDGSVKNVPGWNFTDWADEFQRGTAPAGEDGSSAAMDLQMLHALQSAAAIEEYAGKEEFVTLYNDLADQVSETIRNKYWDESRGIFADTPAHDVFSQHTNSLAILAGLTSDQESEQIAEVMLSDTSLTQATIYFKYYLHLALAEAGYGDDYFDWLDIWHDYIDMGLTTWGETSEIATTRSDAHAWGASPNIEVYRTVLGIHSDAPHFKSVRIEPNLGDIETINGEMPHPDGTIAVDYDNSGRRLRVNITLPDNVDGVFIWNGEERELEGGRNSFRI